MDLVVNDMNTISIKHDEKDQISLDFNFYKNNPLKPRYKLDYEYSDNKVGWSLGNSVWKNVIDENV